MEIKVKMSEGDVRQTQFNAKRLGRKTGSVKIPVSVGLRRVVSRDDLLDIRQVRVSISKPPFSRRQDEVVLPSGSDLARPEQGLRSRETEISADLMLHPFYLVLSVHFPHLFRNDGSALLELELRQFFANFLSFWQDLSPVE